MVNFGLEAQLMNGYPLSSLLPLPFPAFLVTSHCKSCKRIYVRLTSDQGAQGIDQLLSSHGEGSVESGSVNEHHPTSHNLYGVKAACRVPMEYFSHFLVS